MLSPILIIPIAAIIYVYYKYADFYKKHLVTNLSWGCALVLSTAKAWELAIQIMMQGITESALVEKSATLLVNVEPIVNGCIAIAAVLIALMFVPKHLKIKK